MGRQIFKEQAYDVKSLILPIEEFKLFCDREQGLYFPPQYKEEAIANGEALLSKEYRQLTLSEYHEFFISGDRAFFEKHFFARRVDLLKLTVAEAYEKEGRFIGKILDLIWMMLEESTWVSPAGLNPCPNDKDFTIPYSYEGKRNYMDLGAGYTGAVIVWAWYLFHDRFDEMSPYINKRILENLQDRIISPFVDNTAEMAWMGNGKYHWINNWCPWMISNTLNVCAFIETDLEKRQHIVDLALEGLDKFTAIYAEDAACDEGPSYWMAACGALYNACLVLYDMSGGKINIFRDPLMIKMGEFFPKAYICKGRFLNFSDAASKLNVTSAWGHDWGRLSGSDLMQSFWEFSFTGRGKLPALEHHFPYRTFRTLGADELPSRENFQVLKKEFFPSLDLSICRDETDPQKGLYLSLKGHHNSASHNHLDVGNFVIFCDSMPIFIDAGVGTYTARTFNKERYSIWSMRSEYHNLPTINGVDQRPGRMYAAKDAEFDEDSGKLTLDLTGAYHADAALTSYVRSAVIENGKAIVCDEITSKKDGEITFNLLCNCKPENIEKGSFTIHGKLVTFDESLTLEIDEPDCTWVETKTVPASWDCKTIYRVKLKAPLKADEKKSYKIEVCR